MKSTVKLLFIFLSYFTFFCQVRKLLFKNYSGIVKNLEKSALLNDVTGPQQRHLRMYSIILTSQLFKMLQQNGTLSVWKFQPPPLYHGGGLSLHVSLSVNWSDIIQICEKIKN